MQILRTRPKPGVKLYTLLAGDVFSPAEDNEADALVMMVQPTEGRRTGDRYAEKINTVNLVNGHTTVAHGSLRVIHHANAAVILDYRKE